MTNTINKRISNKQCIIYIMCISAFRLSPTDRIRIACDSAASSGACTFSNISDSAAFVAAALARQSPVRWWAPLSASGLTAAQCP